MLSPAQGAPAAGNAGLQQGLRTKLEQIIAVNQLQHFYPPPALQALLNRLNNVDFRCRACGRSSWHIRRLQLCEIVASFPYKRATLGGHVTRSQFVLHMQLLPEWLPRLLVGTVQHSLPARLIMCGDQRRTGSWLRGGTCRWSWPQVWRLWRCTTL